MYGWHWGFGAAGVGMFAGLLIYLCGPALSAAQSTGDHRCRLARGEHGDARGRETFLLLLGIGLAVTVFRGAYEQIGNTLALWIETSIVRSAGSRFRRLFSR